MFKRFFKILYFFFRTFKELQEQVKKRKHTDEYMKMLLEKINNNGNLVTVAVKSKNAEVFCISLFNMYISLYNIYITKILITFCISQLVNMMIKFGFPLKTENYNALHEALKPENR